jgi:putative tricarboxylic transport membrane protein
LTVDPLTAMLIRLARKSILVAGLLAGAVAHAGGAKCIVPSKPGGAMDLTCKLAQKALQGQAGAAPMRLSYLPGGIGAVAWHTLVSERASEPDTLVAFSGGSLLNLAQGKFGKASAGDVRWVAAIGADYGMIAVRADSQYKTLAGLLDALKRNPQKVLIGVSGTIGSQDWLKMALVAQKAGIDPKVLRFVALEGGGEAVFGRRQGQGAGGAVREASARRAGERADRARAGHRRGLADHPRRVDGAESA